MKNFYVALVCLFTLAFIPGCQKKNEHPAQHEKKENKQQGKEKVQRKNSCGCGN